MLNSKYNTGKWEFVAQVQIEGSMVVKLLRGDMKGGIWLN